MVVLLDVSGTVREVGDSEENYAGWFGSAVMETP